jgi:DNA-binding NarL/FixJ family response regulator
MPRAAGKPLIAIVDSKNLRRAGLTSFLEPWANSENLRLMSFNFDQAHQALHPNTNLGMVIFSVGGESIAERENRHQLKALRTLAINVPLVIFSDREDSQEITVAVAAETNGFINNGIEAELACEALSFILHGGSYFPPSAVRQLQMQPEEADKQRDGHGTNINGYAHSIDNYGSPTVNLTVREKEVLKHIRLGESNKNIARQLGMMEGTVKVHLRRLMRKFRASNRTQLALGRGFAALLTFWCNPVADQPAAVLLFVGWMTPS